MKWCSIIVIWVCVWGNSLAQKSGSIQISNPSRVSLSQTVVEIPWATVLAAYPQIDTTQLRVIEAGGGREVPWQLEHRGEKTVRNLLVQLSLAAGKSIQLTLQKQSPRPVAPKTYARYVPERYDDFAWENDRIAFRIYGDALKNRPDNAYGTDVWTKRTEKLVIDKWYKEGNYHTDHGEGLDYYSVGLKLGAGDVGVLLNDTIGYIHNYKTWELLDNGPLRSTFKVNYAPYIFKEITVTTTKTISLDAGSQLSRIEVNMQHTSPQPLPVVAGISLRPEPGKLLENEQDGILGYWEPAHKQDGSLGIGCVFLQEGVPMSRQYGHALARLSVVSNQHFVYFSGAAWDKAGLITSGETWFDYLRQYAARLKSPSITVAVKQ